MLSFCDCVSVTPFSNPLPIAKLEVSVAVSKTPPLATNSCSFATPSQPRPGRMSGVESFLPTRFGVSGVFSHGRGLPQEVDRPAMTVAGLLQPTGGKRMTSYLVLRSGILASDCVLM